MIADIWTLEISGAPGTAQPLHALGVTSATLTRPASSAATLSLSAGPAETTAPLSPLLGGFNQRWLLRRAGVPVFRGRISAPDRVAVSGKSESRATTLTDLWGTLETAPMTSYWYKVTKDGPAPVRTGRVRLARNQFGQRLTAIEALVGIKTAAAVVGVLFDLAPINLDSVPLPAIEISGMSLADAIRAVMKWQPSAIVSIEPSTDGTRDILRVAQPGVGDTETLSAGQGPLTGGSFRPRPDLRVDSVHIHYESEADHSYLVDVPGATDADENPYVRTRRQLAIFTDIWPPFAPLRERSMLVTLPFPAARHPPYDTPPVPHTVEVVTRPLPPTGAVDEQAEKWWLDRLGLSHIGIAVEDIKLPQSDTDTVQSHRVRFAWAADEDPLNDPARKDPINPKSRPLWRPDDVDDLPRELVSGNLAEWMRVRASDVVVDCTVGVSVTAVEALGDRDRKVFEALGAEKEKLGETEYYLVYQARTVRATTAKTKTYKNWPATGSYNPVADTEASLAKAEKEAVIPHLALRLFLARQKLQWEGDALLAQEECGERFRLGRKLNILHPDLPEWATMNALCQRETWRIDTGETNLDFGVARNLDSGEWADLYRATIQAEKSVKNHDTAAPPASRPELGDDPVEDDDDTPGQGGVYQGTVGPVNEVLFPGGGARGYEPGFWVSRAAEEGWVNIAPSVVSGMDGASVMPVVGGIPLTEKPPLSLGGGTSVVALKIEAEPTVQNTGTTEDPSYVIVDGGGEIDGDIEVTSFSDFAAMAAASQIAIIDNGSGDITQNGIYFVVLAMVLDGGGLLQAGHVGPIGVRMCASGTLIVQSPSLQIVAVDPDGKIIAPPAA